MIAHIQNQRLLNQVPTVGPRFLGPGQPQFAKGAVWCAAFGFGLQELALLGV